MNIIKKKLETAPLYSLAGYAVVFIFLVYTCAYAYRKPFTAGLYEGDVLWGFDAKVLYVLAEIVGYALSKFIGIRVLSSMKPNQRMFYIVGLLGFSEIALLGFAVFPISLKLVAIFLSGLPLGMIWGVVFSYIEGRRISEVLNVGLSVALIVSSGLVKTLGQYVMETLNISDYWMPGVTGAIVFPFMLFCVWMLNQIPNPSERDIVLRTKRVPMDRKKRRKFLSQFLLGICFLIFFYAVLTVFRELRDSFAADFWKELGISGAFIFTKTEIPIAAFVLILMFSLVFIHNNRVALNFIYFVALVGGLLLVGSTMLYLGGYISPVWWMVLSGLGMYMEYIPFTYLIERLIASLKVVSTAVFVIYLADSFGYLGTIILFVVKNLVSFHISWNNMFIYTALVVGGFSIATIFIIYRYFRNKIN